MPHKLFIDSRAAVEGGPSDFTWQPERPIYVGKCRAFIDAVHMPVSWGTVTDTNQNLYITEELPLLTVLNGAHKVYLKEVALDGTVSERIASIAPAVYDGPTLATALAAALTQGAVTYSCTHSGTGLGTITMTVSGIASFSIMSRAYLLTLDAFFAGTPLA